MGFFNRRKEKRVFSGGGTSVGVVGALNRIGTTTQALQICGYLSKAGYKVAYVEMCKHDFVEEVVTSFEKAPKAVGKGYTIKGFDVFKGITDVDLGSYDYIVKDYGSVTEKDFNKMSYLEQGIRIMNLGIKPGELKYSENVLEKEEYLSAQFVFAFIPEIEQARLLEDMDEKSDSTFFVPYTPDWFEYTEKCDDLYSKITGIKKNEESETKE